MAHFYTSDTHFFHGNVIKFCNRPFKDSDDMNEELIERWNVKVGPTDHVFHLGDVLFGGDDKLRILDRLNGHKILILGNHDYRANRKSLNKYFKEIHDILVIKNDPVIHRQITLLHYPLAEWPHRYQGGVHLHGHCHGNLKEEIAGRLDVGVDLHPNYEPFSSYELEERFLKLGWPKLDR